MDVTVGTKSTRITGLSARLLISKVRHYLAVQHLAGPVNWAARLESALKYGATTNIS